MASPIARSLLMVVALSLLPAGLATAQNKNLDIYWVDVEGGAATLLVSPSGESLLFDSGWEVGEILDHEQPERHEQDVYSALAGG